MRKKVLRILLNTLLIVGLSSLGLAQRTTETGILNGVVLDEQGMPLPGVTVTSSSPSLMLPQVSTITDTKGHFRLLQLQIGVYKVVFELDGFDTIVREGIKINLGRTTTLNVEMHPTSIEKSITVIGQAPTIDVQKSSAGLTIEGELLTNLPTGRRYLDVFGITPGVVRNSEAREISHGSHQNDNSYNVDGTLSSMPGSGLSLAGIPFEVAEEYQVETAGHPAEYGLVKGATVNMITKSGGNKLSGEVNFYYRDKKLSSDNTKGTPFEGAFVGTNFDYDTTFNLGGPIIKDKLWFFVNYSIQYEETYVNGYPYDKDENTPTDYKRQYPFAKLSWQLNPSMKLIGSWNHWKGDRHHRKASRFENEDTTWVGDFMFSIYNLGYSYIISNNLLYTAKASILDNYTYYRPKNDLPRYYDYASRYYSVSKGSAYLADKKRYQFLTDVTYFVDDFYGRHEFKAGFEYVFEELVQGYEYNNDPSGSGSLFLTRNYGEPYRVYYYDDYMQTNRYNCFGFYIQNRWNPVDRLTFNLGLRFDRQEDIIPKQGEDREYEPARVLETIKVGKLNMLSPRLGVSYVLTGDGKTVIRASYGKYQNPSYLGRFANPNGALQRRYVANPDWSLGNMYYFSASATTEIDPDIKSPYMDEISVGIQREIFPDAYLSINYIKKWDKYTFENVIIEALDVDAIKDGEYIWSNYTPVTVVDPYDGKTVTFYERDPSLVTQTALITNPEPSKRNYSGLEVIFKKRFSNNWQLMASYVYSKCTGLISTSDSQASAYFNDPNVHINAIGRLPEERRHQFKVNGTYRAPFGILISTYYRAYAGTRYTRIIRSDDLGLDLNQGNVSIFAEEKGSRGLPWLQMWDVRIEKQFKIKQFNLGLIVDMFNALNSHTTTAVETISSSPSISFEETTAIKDPRILRLGIRLSW